MSVLRQFIEYVLLEIAKTRHDAYAHGYALFDMHDRGIRRVILYDVVNFSDYVQQNYPTFNDHGDTCDFIVGYLEMRTSNYFPNCYVISCSAARKGFGPLVYDTALSLGKPVIPDRSAVSSDAKKIWYRYNTTRRDVKKTRLPNIDKFRYDDQEDPHDVLNWSYEIVYDTEEKKLERKHEACINDLTAKFDLQENDIELLLKRASDSFFITMYAGLDTYCHHLV